MLHNGYGLFVILKIGWSYKFTRGYRVAFHDFSTANVALGTGGLDASIGFETNRDEDKGAAMNDSLTFFAPFVNKYVSSEY